MIILERQRWIRKSKMIIKKNNKTKNSFNKGKSIAYLSRPERTSTSILEYIESTKFFEDKL